MKSAAAIAAGALEKVCELVRARSVQTPIPLVPEEPLELEEPLEPLVLPLPEVPLEPLEPLLPEVEPLEPLVLVEVLMLSGVPQPMNSAAAQRAIDTRFMSAPKFCRGD